MRFCSEFLAATLSLQVFQGCLGAACHVQLFISVADMRAHGVNADRHAIRDFFVLIAPRESRQNLEFPRREQGQLGSRSPLTLEIGDNFPRDLRGHWRSARAHLMDRIQ